MVQLAGNCQLQALIFMLYDFSFSSFHKRGTHEWESTNTCGAHCTSLLNIISKSYILLFCTLGLFAD